MAERTRGSHTVHRSVSYGDIWRSPWRFLASASRSASACGSLVADATGRAFLSMRKSLRKRLSCGTVYDGEASGSHEAHRRRSCKGKDSSVASPRL